MRNKEVEAEKKIMRDYVISKLDWATESLANCKTLNTTPETSGEDNSIIANLLSTLVEDLNTLLKATHDGKTPLLILRRLQDTIYDQMKSLRDRIVYHNKIIKENCKKTDKVYEGERYDEDGNTTYEPEYDDLEMSKLCEILIKEVEDTPDLSQEYKDKVEAYRPLNISDLVSREHQPKTKKPKLKIVKNEE